MFDRGANGGIAGDDVWIIAKTGCNADVQGVHNHQIVDIPLVSAGAVVSTQRGEIIIIMHQCACTGKGRTIHSSAQLEHYKQVVDDRAIAVGRQQRITTLDGYVIPVNICGGLPYISMRPYTNKEWEDLPHVTFTSDDHWDPSILDLDLDDDELWYDAVSDLPDDPVNDVFDLQGDYRHLQLVSFAAHQPIWQDDQLLPDLPTLMHIHERRVVQRTPDYTSVHRHFAWMPTEVIKKTFECTTQLARMPMSTVLKRYFKTPFPAANIPRHDEPVATDTVYSDVPAVDNGSTVAQFFVGTKSLVTDVFPMSVC